MIFYRLKISTNTSGAIRANGDPSTKMAAFPFANEAIILSGLSVFKTVEMGINYYPELIVQSYLFPKRHLSLLIEDGDLTLLQCED